MSSPGLIHLATTLNGRFEKQIIFFYTHELFPEFETLTAAATTDVCPENIQANYAMNSEG